MKTKIFRGRFQGFALPLLPSNKNQNHYTPMKLKEAFIEILLHKLFIENKKKEEIIFFDLTTGSGQIGIEFLSLNFKFVHFCDIDEIKLSQIQNYIKIKILPKVSNIFEQYKLHKKDFLKMPKLILYNQQNVLYIDLPYTFWNIKTKTSIQLNHFFKNLINEIIKKQSDNFYIWTFIQGPFEFNEIFNLLKSFNFENYLKHLEVRKYGKQILTYFLLEKNNE